MKTQVSKWMRDISRIQITASREAALELKMIQMASKTDQYE